MASKSAEELQQDTDKATREALREATFKKGKFAYYKVGNQGAYSQGVSYQPGDVIRRPVDVLPSLNWSPVADETGTDVEIDAKASAEELYGDEAEAEEPEVPAAKPAKKAPAKPAAKPAKKAPRAADAE